MDTEVGDNIYQLRLIWIEGNQEGGGFHNEYWSDGLRPRYSRFSFLIMRLLKLSFKTAVFTSSLFSCALCNISVKE